MNDFSATPKQATRLDAISGRFDPWLLGAAIALAALGVVMVASSSIAMNSSPFYYLERHLLFLALGAALALWVMRTEMKTVEKHSQLLLLACGVLLLLVWMPGLGVRVNGARRWINLGISRFQVVEAVKVLYIVWLSSYLKRFSDQVSVTWSAMLKPLGVVFVLIALLMIQPDFGSSTLLLGITAGMLVVGGVNLPKMSVPIVVALLGMATLVAIAPYRMRRVTSFLDPWKDQLGSGYQLSNALMAIGRGEWFGVGLGGSVQKLNYLPEAHTDFIFSVIGEELGFIGVCAVIGLYALLVGRAFWVGYRCLAMNRPFLGYVAFGVAMWIGMQASISIGVNLGVLPTKGLTLPLISSGGSSVMMTCVAIGVLLRVSYEQSRAEKQKAVVRDEVGAQLRDAAAAPAAAPSRGTSRLGAARSSGRIEPTFERIL